MKVGSIKGVDLLINPLFLLVCLIGIWFGINETILALAALIAHELAHVLAAIVMDIRIISVELFPFGGQIATDGLVGIKPRREIGAALAGPMVSLFLALVTYIMKGNLELSGFSFFMQFNLLLGCFNLLPAIPLDGGRILKAILSMRLGLRSATVVTSNLGLSLALMLFGLGIYFCTIDWLAVNIILMAGFLAYKAYVERKMLPYSFTRYLMHKKLFLADNRLLPANLMVSRENARVGRVLHRNLPGSCQIVVVLDSSNELLGFLTETQLIDALLEKGYMTTLGKLIDFRDETHSLQ